uniref:Uncharacterized protein n=1 Tax=Calidris pygmaea TaxID=425635 RepID=A0A8C3PGN1_9CHAR
MSCFFWSYGNRTAWYVPYSRFSHHFIPCFSLLPQTFMHALAAPLPRHFITASSGLNLCTSFHSTVPSLAGSACWTSPRHLVADVILERWQRCAPCPPFNMSFRRSIKKIPLLLPPTSTHPSKAVEMMSQEVITTSSSWDSSVHEKILFKQLTSQNVMHCMIPRI